MSKLSNEQIRLRSMRECNVNRFGFVVGAIWASEEQLNKDMDVFVKFLNKEIRRVYVDDEDFEWLVAELKKRMI